MSSGGGGGTPSRLQFGYRPWYFNTQFHPLTTIYEDLSTPPVVTQTGSTNIVSASFSPPANTLLVALVGGGWGTPPVGVTVTDLGSHTWTVAATATGTTASQGGVAKIAYTYLNTAPGAITVTGTFTSLSGGSMLAVRVIQNASPTQFGAGTNSLVNSTASTVGTINENATTIGSQVYGISDCPSSANVFTSNSNTGVITDFPDATDTIKLVSWRGLALTVTPGVAAFGGTWTTSAISNTAVFEVLPLHFALPNMAVYSQALQRASFF
jgi:hypothetical protein